MGFTIDGLREIGELRLPARRGAREVNAVAEYAGAWRWDVVPGTRARRGPAGRPECSCGAGECAAPGRHPLAGQPEVAGGSSRHESARAWARTPGASVLLPTGRRFDVLDAPAATGRRALARLERLGLALGPVAEPPHGRLWFFVAPGSTTGLAGQLDRMGWDDRPLDLRGLGRGGHVTAPPSELGALGPVRWLRAPDPASVEAMPEARQLLGALAYLSPRAALA